MFVQNQLRSIGLISISLCVRIRVPIVFSSLKDHNENGSVQLPCLFHLKRKFNDTNFFQPKSLNCIIYCHWYLILRILYIIKLIEEFIVIITFQQTQRFSNKKIKIFYLTLLLFSWEANVTSLLWNSLSLMFIYHTQILLVSFYYCSPSNVIQLH